MSNANIWQIVQADPGCNRACQRLVSGSAYDVNTVSHGHRVNSHPRVVPTSRPHVIWRQFKSSVRDRWRLHNPDQTSKDTRPLLAVLPELPRAVVVRGLGECPLYVPIDYTMIVREKSPPVPTTYFVSPPSQPMRRMSSPP